MSFSRLREGESITEGGKGGRGVAYWDGHVPLIEQTAHSLWLEDPKVLVTFYSLILANEKILAEIYNNMYQTVSDVLTGH